MARQVLPWVGAAVGFWLGGPTGAQWGFAIGGMVGNAVDPQVIEGPKLGEGQDTTASEGAYRPIVLGKGKVGTCIINQGPLIKRTIRHKQSKGGGPVTTEERFYRTMAFAVGEPADVETGVQLLRMWVDGKLVYDVTPTSQIVADSQEFAEKFTFYPGTMDQQPDPDLEAYMGAGNVSAYQGAPYIVFPHYDVTQAGGRAPMIHVELIGLTSGLGPIDSMTFYRSATHTYSRITLDGREWSNWRNTDGNFDSTNVLATHDRYVVYGTSSSIYSTQNGVQMQLASGGSSSSARQGAVAPHGTIIIPQRNSVMRRSEDNATSFANVSGSPQADAVGYANGRWIAYRSGGGTALFHYSLDDGLSWVQGQTGASFLSVDSIWQTPEVVAIAGAMFSAPNWLPAVLYTSTGTGHVSQALPFGTYSNSTDAGVPGIAFGNGVWVAVHISGKIAYRDDDGWHLSDYEIPVTPVGMTFNGTRFIIVSGSASDGRRVYVSSVNGRDWSVDVDESAGFNSQGNIASLLSLTIVPEKVRISEVVAWLHDRVNVNTLKYDVSELTDLVEGVVFGDGYTAADAIRTAGGWYFFDAGEFDGGDGYRIHYVKRGAGAVATLTDQDIVEGPEDWEREDSYERPRVLHVAYQNPVMDYGAPNIPIKRTSPDVLVVGERSLSVPFVHSDQDEVARRGDIAMTVAYTEIAGKYEVVLPVDWLSLAPTDTIGFSIRGRTRRLRMVSWRYSPDGTIKTEWMADRQSAYTSDLTALPPTPTTPPPPSIVGPTVSAVLDIPALTDSLDSLHLVLAASGQTPAWWGALHQRRLEAETDFSTAMVFNPPTTIMGVLSDDVSEASPHYTDTTNVVRVTLYSDDELDTHTQQQFLSENGAFALSWDDGGTRRWEIMQYRDAVKVGDQEWELSTLSRGRLDTDTAPHPAGSMFVLLDVGVRAAPAQVSWIGQDIEHRAVSNGQQPDQAVPYTEEYTGQSQREWPVAHLFGEIDGDDLLLTCVPRHRFGTEDNPVQSINHDGYRWTATDGSSSVTADTAAPSHTFDVTGWTTPITVTVAQLNRITGAGPAVSETIYA